MAQKSRNKFSNSTIDAHEVGQFNNLAKTWWDAEGPMRPLHALNPVRMGYLRQQLCRHFSLDDSSRTALKGLKVLDIGCGGGLVTEPLCRMGAAVTGIDAGRENIKVATAHAKAGGLGVDYKTTTAEDMAATGKKFDVVTALEIVEHVSDAPLFLSSCAQLVRPGGLLVISTLNRNAKSYLLGIVAAEHILRWVPAGTHDWKKFLKPSEISRMLEPSGVVAHDLTGLVFNPLKREFALSKTDLDVNYFLTAIKK